MRKSNWIIAAILVVASIFFLWLWYYLQFNLIDDPFDLVLTIIWWCLIALAVFAIHRAEKKRQERIRSTFLAPAALWNCEAGVVEAGAGAGVEAGAGTGAGASAAMLATLEQTLAGLEYNFKMQDFPEDDASKFEYIVHSEKFKFDKDNDNSEQSEGAIKVTEWEGDVVSVAHPDDEPQKFSNRDELAAILQGGTAAQAA